MHNRTWTFGVFLISVLVAACSGGGNSAPPPVPTGSASGTVLDGLIMNGTVTAYDYSTGSKGAVLGQATTDSRTGTYSLSLQAESRPILLEITGGYYNEEMDPSTNIPLDTGDKMQAVINYTTGAAVTTSITAMTTGAAGLAAYEIKKGTAVATAVEDANRRFSNLVGFDIIKTVPLEITDLANASASLTPALQYGFLAGGISMWVSKNYPNPTGLVPPLQKPYISIKFVQLMYQDIAADGLLDGKGLDSNSTPVQLSFGTAALSPTVYRQGIGVSMLQMADNPNNKTGLNSSKVLPFGQTYAGNTDPMWASVPTVPISSPSVTINAPTANQWVRGTVNVAATAQDYVGLSSESLSIDGNALTTITTNLTTPVFPVNTAIYGDGAHTITLAATNAVGLTTTTTVPVKVDNTPPTISVNATVGFSNQYPVYYCSLSGSVADSTSGPVSTVYATWQGITSGSSTLVNNTFSFNLGDYITSTLTQTGPLTITATDNAGNSASITKALSLVTTCVNRGCVITSCSLQ